MADSVGSAILEIRTDIAGAVNDLGQFKERLNDTAGSAKNISTLFSIDVFTRWGREGLSAITSIAEGIVELGVRGAAVNDVREAFAGLTQGAGQAAEVMLGELRAGTLNTISDFDLMQMANKALGAGLKLTTADMGTLAAGAKMLSDRTGKDTKEAFEALEKAMVTGRTRGLAEFGFGAKDAASVLVGLREQLQQAGASTEDFEDSVNRGRATLANLNDSLSVITAKALPDLMSKFGSLGLSANSMSDGIRTAMNFVANAIVNSVEIGVNAITGFVQAMVAAATTVSSQAAQMWDVLTGKVGVKEALQNIAALAVGGLAAIREGITLALNPTLTWKDYLAATGNTATVVAEKYKTAVAKIIKADLDQILSRQHVSEAMRLYAQFDAAAELASQQAIVAAQKAALAAMRNAQGAWAVQTMALAEAAGFKTRDELEHNAKVAAETYQRMLDSGLYTYAELQKAHAASVAAQEELDGRHAKSATEKFLMIAEASSTILRSLFGKNKAAAIAAAIIDTAAAVVSSFKNAGGFPWGLIPAAAMAAAGAKQISQIKSQQFSEGTPGLDFMSFGAARNVTVHGDEAILPRGKGHVLAGEIAQAMPGGGSETAMHLRALRGSMDALPYTLVRALRSARVMAMA